MFAAVARGASVRRFRFGPEKKMQSIAALLRLTFLSGCVTRSTGKAPGIISRKGRLREAGESIPLPRRQRDGEL